MTKMKRYLAMTVLLALVLTVAAQERKKFSPEKFQADMEAFITQQANLTPQEAAKLFPLMREMQDKQRAIYKKVHKMVKDKPDGEAGCVNVIEEYDKANIELKKIERCYHQKMMKEVPASKVYDLISAEYRFHRGWMKGAQKKDRKR